MNSIRDQQSKPVRVFVATSDGLLALQNRDFRVPQNDEKGNGATSSLRSTNQPAPTNTRPHRDNSKQLHCSLQCVLPTQDIRPQCRLMMKGAHQNLHDGLQELRLVSFHDALRMTVHLQCLERQNSTRECIFPWTPPHPVLSSRSTRACKHVRQVFQSEGCSLRTGSKASP